MIEQEYYFNLMDVAHAIRECGAPQLWLDLKKYYPEEFNQLLYAAQDATQDQLIRQQKEAVLLRITKLNEEMGLYE